MSTHINISMLVRRTPLLLWCFLHLVQSTSCGNQEEPLTLDLRSSPVVAKARSGNEVALRFAVAPVLSSEKAFVPSRLLAKYLARRLETPVELIQRRTYREINEMIRLGTVQFALVCTGAFVVGDQEFGMQVVAVPRYKGKTEYHSYIIVRKESPFRKFEDLEGKKIAVSDPLSNSGYFYPMFLVRQMGRDPNKFFDQMLFTYSHDSSIQAVEEGITDAAAVDSLIFDYELSHNVALDRSLRIVRKSPPFGINPIVACRTAPKDTVEAVKRILLAMDLDTEGRMILDLLQIDDFIEPPEGIYEASREMILQVVTMEGSR